jgi:hypothetical protein
VREEFMPSLVASVAEADAGVPHKVRLFYKRLQATAFWDEFTFWFNRRTSCSCGKLFYGLLRQAMEVGPTP